MRRWVQVVDRGESPDGGFSLIEMLVVIVIIGVLATVVLLAVGGIKNKGESSSCSEDYRTIQTAEEAYYAKPVGGAAYTDMSGLVSSHLLAEPSALYDVEPSASSYMITAVPNNANACTAPPT